MKISAQLLITLSILAVVGCSSDPEPKPEPEAVELKVSDAPSIDTPEAILFHEAKRLYRAGLYSVAIDSLENLRLNYPLSPYVEFAELKIADAHYETRDYAVAATAYEEFTKNHPASPAVPYVLMRAGNSYRMTNRGVGRDTAPLEKARGFFTRLLKDYPTSIYTGQAKIFLDETNQSLAEYQKLVTEYYRSKSNEKAVAARTKYFEEKFGHLANNVQANTEIPVPVAIIPGGSPVNPQLISAHRMSDQEFSDVRASQVQPEEPLQRGMLIADAQETQTFDLQRVQCRDDKIFLYLREPITDQEFLTKNGRLVPQAGTVSISLPNVLTRQTVMDCFGKNDLNISSSGIVSITDHHSYNVMALNNPPRLLLVQE